MKKYGKGILYEVVYYESDLIVNIIIATLFSSCLKLAMNLLPYIQSASNPLIYCFMSKNFRWSLRTACRSCCHCDPATVMHRKRPHMEFDMDTKSVTINGTYTSRMSPGATRNARTSVTAVAEF